MPAARAAISLCKPGASRFHPEEAREVVAALAFFPF
jgi:hypothetical protein